VSESRPQGKVVVAYPWDADDASLEPLRARLPGLDFVAAPYFGKFAHHVPGASDTLSDDERKLWADAEVTLALDLPPDIAELAPGLRWVQAIGAGVDHLKDADLADGVMVTNAAGVAAVPIAEFAIGRLLEVWKHFGELDRMQRDKEWKPTFGVLAEGQTLGIIGLGAIGRAVATRARAFGMHVIGTRRSYQPGDTHPTVDELRGADELHEVLAQCDAVVVAAPGTDDTESMFDAAAFAAMKPRSVFCNVGRGSLVDEPALIAALEHGHLGAAILDVTRQEPMPPDDPLWDAPNIYISPHCSASQDRYVDKLFDLFAENLEHYGKGEPLRNVVDLTAGY
jgi:phosphoglycerate dehydrogenase-like enzyme